MPSWTKEPVYDAEIAPLMSRIIDICKKHRIPLVAVFQYADMKEEGPAYVSTLLPDKRQSDHMRDLNRRAKPEPSFMALTETTVTDPATGHKTVTIKRVL